MNCFLLYVRNLAIGIGGMLVIAGMVWLMGAFVKWLGFWLGLGAFLVGYMLLAVAWITRMQCRR